MNGKFEAPASAPTEEEITTMLNSSLAALRNDQEDNLNKIGLQKWIDFDVMLNYESWAEMRRSGYPKLYIPTDAGNPSMRHRLPACYILTRSVR